MLDLKNVLMNIIRLSDQKTPLTTTGKNEVFFLSDFSVPGRPIFWQSYGKYSKNASERYLYG